jgi:hypothetical protein
LGDLSDQEVHRERSGQTIRIILVSERQVDHGAVAFIELICFIRSGRRVVVVVLLAAQFFDRSAQGKVHDEKEQESHTESKE